MADSDPPRLPRGDLPEGIDPIGVPRQGSGHEAFVIAVAVVVALLVLTFTLGWIVFHRLTSGG